MSFIDINEVKQSSVLYMYSLREKIDLDPPYQRMGDIWTLDKKQLLIDSIFNNFDVPKIYFHKLDVSESSYRYSIIDGRQRLEAIWAFIDGHFALANDFKYMPDEKIDLSGMTYQDIANTYPMIRHLFDSYTLSVYAVTTDDIDLIEEMFSRLNEAVPLNAAEKRNAFGGPLPKIIRTVAEHEFFTENSRVSNKRFQHRDIAVKLLYLTHSDRIVDTKKAYLDHFVKDNKTEEASKFHGSKEKTRQTLSVMSNVFVQSDPLLRSSGMIVVYFCIFKWGLAELGIDRLSRSVLEKFEQERKNNRKIAEDDISKAQYAWLEFDRLMQTPNDAYAIRERYNILLDYIRSQSD
jgi:hypothetical protein